MAEAKFTPGPWIGLRLGGAIHGGPMIEYANGRAMKQIGLACLHDQMEPSEREANQALMVAAPRMHEILSNMVRLDDDSGFTDDDEYVVAFQNLVEQARAVLADVSNWSEPLQQQSPATDVVSK